MRVTIAALGIALLALVAAVPQQQSAAPRDDANWTEHYFPSSDGINTLHADVFRPVGLADDEPTPVILTVSPYLNHSGSLPYPGYFDPTGDQRPNERFFDFLNLSGALDEGYTYVQVDLPGTGGSSGCNDWGGLREQTAVKDAVEWAASQPWSTGKVGLLGKSYDGWTGLMGIAQQPEGLAAVVSLEPVYSGYRYLYNNGVRFTNSVLTPAIFQADDAMPGHVDDDPQYHANGAPQVWCYGVNYGMQQSDDDQTPYWLERDLLTTTDGKTTPLFLTQGFLEANTKPDGAFDYYNGLAGTENRAWFGQFDHCRGWETEDACNNNGNERLAFGRDGFIDEVMRFFDEHLKGIEPGVEDPTIVVQDNLGRYRAEEAWPPSDVAFYDTELAVGTYTDDGLGADTQTEGIWSVSQPLPHDVWMAGEPVVEAVLDAVPRSNLVVNVYDVDPDSGGGVLVSRGTTLYPRSTLETVEAGGLGDTVSFDLYGQDWLFEEGHHIAVRITDANSNWWVHVGTRSDVTVTSATISLPFLTHQRDAFLDGGSTPRLEDHLGSARVPMDPSLIDGAGRDFTLPPALSERTD